MARLIVFTDLDGTLLDHRTYSWSAAQPALDEIARQRIPLIFCTSKTRAEVEALRRKLGNAHPFIIENGGGVFIPHGYFPHPISNARPARHYHCIALGRDYKEVTAALLDISQETGVEVVGFHQMSAREVARNSGLPLNEVDLARQREFDEPFFFAGSSPRDEKRFAQAAARRSFGVTRGSRFWHLFSGSDKGRAVRELLQHYRKAMKHSHVRAVALGDSLNDLPMLRSADKAILLPLRGAGQDAEFDEETLSQLRNVTQAPAPGPRGWNAAVLRLLGIADAEDLP